MKLTSIARLRIATVAITTILTASIGLFVTVQSYQGSLRTIDNGINGTVADAAASPNEELSAALFHIKELSLDLSLLLVSRDGTTTEVNQSTIILFDEISLEQVVSATKNISAGMGASEYRFRSLPISGGDYLVVAASAADALKNFHANQASVLLITLLLSFFAYLLLTVYTKKLKQRDDEAALKRMQSFLGDASHELRTPLTVIKGYVEMLSKGLLKEESDRDRALVRVTHEIGRMESLIHDLLLLAELGESAHREQEVIDISEITDAHVKDFITLNPTRVVTLAIDSHINVDMVRDHYLRFIQNSLNNISRHTPAAAPVRISLVRQSKSAQLTIEDGGPGLPKGAYKERVQSLNRFDKSRSRESGGSGLGMSIMAGVISKSDGELTLKQSALGGLAIVATIPLHRE